MRTTARIAAIRTNQFASWGQLHHSHSSTSIGTKRALSIRRSHPVEAI